MSDPTTWPAQEQSAYSAGFAAAQARIDRLRDALKPFADAVYNDNGSMTVTPASYDDYVRAYFVMRDIARS